VLLTEFVRAGRRFVYVVNHCAYLGEKRVMMIDDISSWPSSRCSNVRSQTQADFSADCADASCDCGSLQWHVGLKQVTRQSAHKRPAKTHPGHFRGSIITSGLGKEPSRDITPRVCVWLEGFVSCGLWVRVVGG